MMKQAVSQWQNLHSGRKQPRLRNLLSPLFLLLYSPYLMAASSHQVDLIIFAQKFPSKYASIGSAFIPSSQNSIPLKTNPSTEPYHLLKPALSGLNNEYYLLKHKYAYQVLGIYSWRQPKNNSKHVILPKIQEKDWALQGSVLVRYDHYFFFDAKLQYDAKLESKNPVFISQKQRLMDNTVYYFDHPAIGILVKVH